MSNSVIEKNDDVDPGQLVAGQMLAQQREKLGLTIDECAETLKLSPAKVNALEVGDKKPFSSEVFIRGYLKSYAKLLRLPESEILSGYYSQRDKEQLEHEEELRAKAKGSKWWLPYAAGIVIIAGWFVLSDYLDRQERALLASSDSQAQEASVQDSQVQVVGSEAGIQQESSATLDLSGKLEATESLPAVEEGDISVDEIKGGVEAIIESATDNVDVPDVGQEVPEVSAIPEISESAEVLFTASPPPEATKGKDELIFTFAESCWIEIVDATNNTIVSSLRAANTRLQVQGLAPFSIILGNVSGTTLEFNGKTVALNNNRDSKTLRLTVGS